MQLHGGLAVSGKLGVSLHSTAEQSDAAWLFKRHSLVTLPKHFTSAYVQEYANQHDSTVITLGFFCPSPMSGPGRDAQGKDVQAALQAETTARGVHWLPVVQPAWCAALWPAHVEELEPLLGACVQRNEGWWTYEVCVGRQVRQFHAAAGASDSADFSLGLFQAGVGTIADTVNSRERLASGQTGVHQGGSIAPLSSGTPEAPALVQFYASGTVCAETGRGREAEVRFVCQADEALHIQSVKELATCQYVITVGVAAACQHEDLATAMQSQGPSATDIHCVQVPA